MQSTLSSCSLSSTCAVILRYSGSGHDRLRVLCACLLLDRVSMASHAIPSLRFFFWSRQSSAYEVPARDARRRRQRWPSSMKRCGY